MDIKYSKDRIEFEKELNSLDKFVIDFCSILNKLKIKYVIMSGYVAILFGRNRSSEDIDMFIEEIDFNKFKSIWDELKENFSCVNTDDVEDAFYKYLKDINQIRFSRKDRYVPNIEMKFPKRDIDHYILENRILVMLNKHMFFIANIEEQIAYKLYLGSEKDIEDAVYLYEIFKENINVSLLDHFCRKLNIEETAKKHLYESAKD